MDDLLAHTEHRPWPVPARRWSVAMRWHDLLFAHWPVQADQLRPHVPAELEIDTWDGWAWIGVVPFRMSGVRHRLFPDRCSMAFPELNVRTYVQQGGKPGIWFFSLDADNRLAVRAARMWYGLPYFDARMTVRDRDGRIQYESMRTHRAAPPAKLHMAYAPVGTVFYAAPSTIEHWLIERYCLYSAKRGRVGRGDIHHPRWPLQLAEADFDRNTMAEQIGIQLPGPPALLHFAKQQAVVAWSVRSEN